jgi:hypothetical protein
MTPVRETPTTQRTSSFVHCQRVGGAKQNLVGAQFHSWAISKSRSPVMESKTSGDRYDDNLQIRRRRPITGSDVGLDHHDIVHQTISTRRPDE